MAITFNQNGQPQSSTHHFPAQDREQIEILVKDNDNNPIIELIEFDENSGNRPKIHQVFPLKNDDGTFSGGAAVKIWEEGEGFFVQIGSGTVTDEEDGYYGEFLEPGHIGDVDLRDVRLANQLPILNRPYPIHVKLDNSTEPYLLSITYKATV